jgi:endonuclease/exonuclease/phosphatase family metal-dependent hydrolase
LVSVVGATTTSLQLRWPAVAGATGYEVARAADPSLAGASTVVTTTTGSLVAGGLRRGATYCFTVRALVDGAPGPWSGPACKPTIRADGPAAGVFYRVMAFNVCSRVCADWSSRRAAVDQVIAVRRPDVIAMAEADYVTRAPSGYRLARYAGGRRLLYRADRFRVAGTAKHPRSGVVLMAPDRRAVWAVLVDRTHHGKRVMFVAVHTTAPPADYAQRGHEIAVLLRAIGRRNTGHLPVVYAGDFNSYKRRGSYDPAAGRGDQDTVGATFARAGYYDAFDLARRLYRPNWSSFSGFGTTPAISPVWGDHVDHVYVVPGRTRVLSWMNAGLVQGAGYASPVPSDHRPVQASFRLS